MCKKMTTRTRTVLTLAAVAMAILGLTTTSANAGVISYVQITNDADCGISADKTYTHTLDFGTGSPGALINGVQFDAYNNAANGTLNFNRTATSGTLNDHAGDGSHNVSGNLVNLMTDMYFNNNNAVGGSTTWTLSGLTAGHTYSTRIYSRQWVVSNRTSTIVFDPDGGGAISDSTGPINQDDASASPPGFTNANDAYYINYQFTAVAGQDLVITATQNLFNQSWHLYGLTNEIAGPVTKAYGPSPEDGAQHNLTYITLGWKPGDLAASHNVYMGDNFDDVNDGTGDTFRGNQPLISTYYVAGFTGFAYPDGLVNGTTYYWRIDEVNDADPNSPWKGDVWSLWIPSKNAYDPVPGDGGKFVDSENPVLAWTPGFGAVLHTVYFGDDYDTVANAADGVPQGFTNFSPGPLEVDKTYFWRVDEFEVQDSHTGDVWSFTTAKVGGGIRADYYRGMNFDNFALTRTDPRIDFNWGDPGGPDATVGDDNFSARWTGEVEAAFTETYTFYARADDGVRLWVDGRQLVDAWIDQSATEYRGTIDLVAGNVYSLVMEYYENAVDAVAELRWSSPSTPKDFVPQAALAPPVKARSPNPANGATGTKMTLILRWDAGDYAASHEVYFGTDADAVKNATRASPEYIGPMELGSESYEPGKLAWESTYYWRVDEVNNLNPDGPWVGNLWSFTTGDLLVIDDFEDYDAGDNRIFYAWHDRLGYDSADPPYLGNGTGSMVGDDSTSSYTEETIVHSGGKSMPYWYNNNMQGYAYYSEAELTLTTPRDWTEEGVAELSLWFRGNPASVGSFTEGLVGTYTMTASGADIWAVNGVEADEFHFAYKMLTGAGSIVARVDSVENTNDWAKAGVMIRETLDPDSAHAFMTMTPTQGVSFQRRPGTGATSESDNSTTGTETAPYWVKIERDLSRNFTAYHSANGSAWTIQGAPENIPMGDNVYIGLAVTSHDAALTCQAVFSNVTTTGAVSQQWTHQDIGIASNTAEPLYVAVSNSAGEPAVVVHDDPAAATIDTWTEWIIPLQAFADQGINLNNVDRIAIGLGTKGNMTTPGGSGKMFFDDIRLYRLRTTAGFDRDFLRTERTGGKKR